MKITDEPIIVEADLPCTIDEAWKAITELPQMHKWFFEEIKNYEPVIGFETRFDVSNESRVFPHIWKITLVDPPYEIKTNWKYDGYEGNSFVTFKLRSEGKTTNLKIITEIVEDFQDGIPEFTRESCLGGWNYFADRLNSYLQRKFENN